MVDMCRDACNVECWTVFDNVSFMYVPSHKFLSSLVKRFQQEDGTTSSSLAPSLIIILYKIVKYF